MKERLQESMPNKPESNDQSSSGFGPFAFLGKFLDFTASFIGQDAPPFVKIVTLVLVCLVIVFIVALSLAGGKLSAEQLYKITIVTMVVLAVSLIGVLSVQQRGRRTSGSLHKHPHVPKQPLESATAETLSKLLSEIRKKASEYLRDTCKIEEVQDDYVRANVFLFDYGLSDNSVPGYLYMPQEFRINMNTSSEWSMKFVPGQGLTGQVYQDGDYRIAHRHRSGSWDREYKLTKKQLSDVDSNLQWITSFPLSSKSKRQVLGVLNVDGLKIDVADEHLGPMMREALEANVKAFAALLEQQPSLFVVQIGQP